MEVMEIAATLGKAIKEHEVYKKFLEAKEAYDNNEELNRKIMEYGVQQQVLANEAGKEEQDTAVMEQIQNRLDVLYKEICEDKTFLAVNEAQDAVNELMNAVNETISYNITGEQACTHDCSTCGGCGHSH
jgi:cell fate (sporulation/competence/biofilm development) regulator YlbF (YheA/YmcA/DUF963 family)